MKFFNLPLSKIIAISIVLFLVAGTAIAFAAMGTGFIPTALKASSSETSSQNSDDNIQVIAPPNVKEPISSESSSEAQSVSSSSESELQSSTAQSSSKLQSSQSASTPAPVANVTAAEYRAVWISYLEWQGINLKTEQSFTSSIRTMLDNCAGAGINRAIVQVRPFGDALYKSDLFPTSHLITGTQGDPLAYDPLEVIIREAKARSIKVEAWLNPYRVKLSEKMPAKLAQANPAAQFMNEPSTADYAIEVGGGIYYNPAIPEVQELIVKGVEEITRNYDIDGIQFDDYFYPTTEASFDKSAYERLSSGKELSAFRRDNVNTLVAKTYKAIKTIKPHVVFGISPQGNNQNNYSVQYSDVKLWLANPGYVDYIMPQLYWGFGYLTASGRTDYQFSPLAAEWASFKRAPSVQLYIGIGAFRIGAGDGGANDQAEWNSGSNLAKMVTQLRSTKGVTGFGIYRYDNIFSKAELNVKELQSLKSVLK